MKPQKQTPIEIEPLTEFVHNGHEYRPYKPIGIEPGYTHWCRWSADGKKVESSGPFKDSTVTKQTIVTLLTELAD